MKENFNNSEANFAPETMNAYEASTSTNATSIDLQDEDYNLCSAIVEQKLEYENYRQCGDEEKKAEYLAHKEFYNNVTKYAKGFQILEEKALTNEVIGGAYAYLVLTRGYDEETVKDFLNNYSLNTATDC